MKKLVLGIVLLMPLAACTNTERGAAIGAGSGALIGAAVASPGNTGEGALVGGALGAVAGALIGQSTERPGYCEYRDRRGRRYIERCPRGYVESRYDRRRYDDDYDRYERPRYRRPYRGDDYYYDE